MTVRRQPVRRQPAPVSGLLRRAARMTRLLVARDRGSFTAEMAAGLPALMLLLFFGLTAVTAVTAKGQCVDAAREGALAAARGDPGTGEAGRIAPHGADIGIVRGSGTVTVTVRAPVTVLGGDLPVLEIEARATAAREPEMIP